MRARFEANCAEQERAPEQVLDAFLRGAQAESFWQTAKTNLQAGRIRLVFVADEIPPELRRIVEFLNAQMDPAEVLAIEIRQYVGQGLKALVPRLIGQTTRKKDGGVAASPVSGKRQWDESSFFARITEWKGAEDAWVARRILDWARAKGLLVWWGQGKTDGSFYVGLEHAGVKHWPLSIWTSAVAEVEFADLLAHPPFDEPSKRLELVRHLNEIPGVAIGEDKITRRPNLKLALFRTEVAFAQFLGVLDNIVRDITVS